MAESLRAVRVSPLYLMLMLVAIAHAIPVWSVRYFPTQDGPAHVENAVILRKLIAGDKEIPYQINRRPVPNWLGHAILAALTAVMSPRVAEKVLVSMYVIALPLAVAYAARAVRRGGEWVGFLALPFVYSLALHKGLYNFCLSLVMFFLLIGYVIRHFDSIRWRDVAATAALALVLYFSHIVSLGIAGAVLGALGLGVMIKRRREGTPLPLAQIEGAAVALAPAIALAVAFFATGEREAFDQRPIGVQLLRFFELDALAALRKPELLIAIAFSTVIWVTILSLLAHKLVKRTWNAWDGLLLIALALLIVYALAPNSAAGGGQISFRLSLYPYFVLLMWIAAQPIAKPCSAVVLCSAIAASMVFAAVRWPAQRKLSSQLAEYVSVAPSLEDGRSVVAIDASRETEREKRTTWRISPFWHAMGYVAVQRNLFDFGNYEQKMGYFPVISPGIWSMTTSLKEDRVTDDERYAMGTAADYVVVWSVEPGKVDVSEPTAARLRQGYDVEYTSPRGMAVVWRKKR